MSTETINAIQVHAYGDADQLKLERIARPEPKEGEVLVRVHAGESTRSIGRSARAG